MSTTGPIGTMFNLAEPHIPGYTRVATRRIGVGGYGRRSGAPTAPGGIAKAIKIVYGYHDDERRHARAQLAQTVSRKCANPFLLSLGADRNWSTANLVIVTELGHLQHEGAVRSKHLRAG